MNPVPGRVRLAMLLRSFTIQGSWNYETLIGAGFGFTLLPALRWLYADRPDELCAALARHTELFNSHPYMVTVAVGTVCRLEAEGAEPAIIQRVKTGLRGALGSLGDRLVWTVWRPLSVLLGLILLLGGAPWWVAVVVFLVIYNTLHIALRIQGLNIGLRAGLEIGRFLRESPFQKLIERGSQVAAFLVGVAVVMQAAPAVRDPQAAALVVASVVLGFWLGSRTRLVLALALAAVAVLAIVSGIIGYGA